MSVRGSRGARLLSRRATSTALLVAWVGAGCAPHISITPTPHVVCAGSTLTLEWKGCGQTVEVVKDDAHVLCPTTVPCPVPKSDVRTVRVGHEKIALTFVARNGYDPVHSETAQWEALPVEGSVRRVASILECDAATRMASGHIDIDEKDWGPGLTIDDVRVTAPANRIVRVLHGTAQVDLGPSSGPPSSSPSPFQGKPAMGRWTIQVPFVADETCGHVNLADGHVQMTFTAQCGN